MACVGKFIYNDEALGHEAQAELDKIIKLEEKMNYDNPQVVFALYTKMIQKKVFHTAIGLDYLSGLYNYLNERQSELPDGILTIPAEAFANDNKQEIEKYKAIVAKQKDEIEQLKALQQSVTNNETDGGAQGENSGAALELATENDAVDEETSEYVQKLNERYMDDLLRKYKRSITQNNNLSSQLIIHRIAIVLLMVVIVVMLVIAKKSDSPTILNYREQIQNEYSEWQQQLDEREQELRERESAITNNQ